MMKNRKGAFIVTFLIVTGIILLVLFLLGGLASLGGILKLFEGLKSIPMLAWIAIAIVLFLIIIPKGK
jgi:hypothetical protein